MDCGGSRSDEVGVTGGEECMVAPLWSPRCDGGTWIPACAGMTIFVAVSARGGGGGVVLYSLVRD